MSNVRWNSASFHFVPVSEKDEERELPAGRRVAADDVEDVEAQAARPIRERGQPVAEFGRFGRGCRD